MKHSVVANSSFYFVAMSKLVAVIGFALCLPLVTAKQFATCEFFAFKLQVTHFSAYCRPLELIEKSPYALSGFV